jgi:hypothetical protein
MFILLVVAALSVAAIAATVVALPTDDFRAVPTDTSRVQ